MASQQRDDDDLDRHAWAQAHDQFQRLQTHLPEAAVGNVAREVVRRLAFRMPRFGAGTEAPEQTDIARFCATLTATHEEEAERFVRKLRRSGNSVQTIYLSYIAAAARELGRQWDEDELSFADVTMASGRLYRIIRGLRHVLDRDGPQTAEQDRVLLTLIPGDNHTLASEMAADLFRREGWDIDLSVGEDHDAVVTRADVTRFAAIVLVANGVHALPQLTRLVIGLRIVAPMTPLTLAGKILDTPGVAELCGVDAVITTLESAPQRLREIARQPAGPGSQPPVPQRDTVPRRS
ncbi:cobalamin B12-binding domain-containing protein [Loktanella sp. DJP18]|uniref:cobalamin B12-binding domain-containing protein n=1 Tax=Loktanella sp. DJP18 TaxID=3409788 RepID=UPI003BB66FDE